MISTLQRPGGQRCPLSPKGSSKKFPRKKKKKKKEKREFGPWRVKSNRREEFPSFYTVAFLHRSQIRPIFLGQILPVTQLLSQNGSFFSLGALREKIESFWPKKLGRILVAPVTQPFRSKWLYFFSRCTERKNWVTLT